MLRSLSTTKLLQRGIVGRVSAPFVAAAARRTEATLADQTQVISTPTQAISNPTLANIEKRWLQMPPQEQAELWMALRDRMQGDWHDLTFQEKKAAYWIAFGPHGPREPPPPAMTWFIFNRVAAIVVVSTAIAFTLRYFARPMPHTLSQEWQEASNEYLKKQKADPITGWASPNYAGKGMVQWPQVPPNDT